MTVHQMRVEGISLAALALGLAGATAARADESVASPQCADCAGYRAEVLLLNQTRAVMRYLIV